MRRLMMWLLGKTPNSNEIVEARAKLTTEMSRLRVNGKRLGEGKCDLGLDIIDYLKNEIDKCQKTS